MKPQIRANLKFRCIVRFVDCMSPFSTYKKQSTQDCKQFNIKPAPNYMYIPPLFTYYFGLKSKQKHHIKKKIKRQSICINILAKSLKMNFQSSSLTKISNTFYFTECLSLWQTGNQNHISFVFFFEKCMMQWLCWEQFQHLLQNHFFP